MSVRNWVHELYPPEMAERVIMLIDQGAFTIPDYQSPTDWEVDLSSVGPGWNGKVTL